MTPSFAAVLRIALPALLVSLATIDTADAQRRNRGGRGNGDGWKFVSKKYDANKDGSVTSDEYTRGEEAFKALDVNSDGVLDEKDWQGRSRRRSTAPAPGKGDAAPDFSLTKIEDPDSTMTLSDFAGKKPVALLFGSCT